MLILKWTQTDVQSWQTNFLNDFKLHYFDDALFMFSNVTFSNAGVIARWVHVFNR